MSNENKNKTLIIKSMAKMLSDKKIVRSYIKGNTSIKTLDEKGIKFAKPL